MIRLPRRLAALLFAFVGGGFGLPDLDALLYHSAGRGAPAEVPHFDLPGGCGAHAEHCVLAVAASLRQLGSRLVTPVRVTQTAAIRPLLIPVVAPRSADRSFPHPSRAPPFAAT